MVKKFLEVLEEDAALLPEVSLTDEQRGILAARDRLAEQLGEDADAIRISAVEMASRLMQAGVVIALHIGNWTGKRKLQPADLGLDDLSGDGAQKIRQAISLGEMALMPPTLMRRRDSIIIRMRRNLDRYSISTAWGAFVPAGSYEVWKRRHEELEQEFFSIRDDLVEHLPDLRTATSGMWAELRLAHEAHAPLVWCRLQRLEPTEANLAKTPEWFTRQYLNAVFDSIPPVSYISASFYVQAVPTFIPLPSVLLEDELRQKQLIEQSQAERQLQAEVSRYYREQKMALVDDFLAELVREVRSRVYDVVTAALASLQRNEGKLVGKSAQSLRNLIDWIRAMNIYGDEEIAVGLEKLQSQLDRVPETRDVARIEQQLWALGTVARSTLLDLGLDPKIEDQKLSVTARDGVLGLRQETHRALAAQAREKLGTSELPELGAVRLRRLQALD